MSGQSQSKAKPSEKLQKWKVYWDQTGCKPISAVLRKPRTQERWLLILLSAWDACSYKDVHTLRWEDPQPPQSHTHGPQLTYDGTSVHHSREARFPGRNINFNTPQEKMNQKPSWLSLTSCTAESNKAHRSPQTLSQQGQHWSSSHFPALPGKETVVVPLRHLFPVHCQENLPDISPKIR